MRRHGAILTVFFTTRCLPLLPEEREIKCQNLLSYAQIFWFTLERLSFPMLKPSSDGNLFCSLDCFRYRSIDDVCDQLSNGHFEFVSCYLYCGKVCQWIISHWSSSSSLVIIHKKISLEINIQICVSINEQSCSVNAFENSALDLKINFLLFSVSETEHEVSLQMMPRFLIHIWSWDSWIHKDNVFKQLWPSLRRPASHE